MAGNNSRIHGYNRNVYGDRQKNSKFQAFDWEEKRPSKFLFKSVEGSNPVVEDHQGHIVPQGMLNLVLDPLSRRVTSYTQLREIKKNEKKQYPWINNVLSYLEKITDNKNNYTVDNFFSIVTWNPVNICRAPSDNKRNGYPGEKIDKQVIDSLKLIIESKYLKDYWLPSLEKLKSAKKPDVEVINEYITTCSSTLSRQLENPLGYYAFPWHEKNGILFPGKE
ncbi:hypothetical protein IQ235_15370 [Oscillatoriales cyanobacterium LEGE 11467]|uniref:Uncharacterized protein n=1 Tax=Zarconia navalis LEGE 11467 TaxID=1828826 RepID=A0A928Z9W1_9CYAN|nr:hypothetical protein [Zarconia navalis]MBE9042159.1 hypothetical protein [Zarconia navalis LEGE 11467]